MHCTLGITSPEGVTVAVTAARNWFRAVRVTLYGIIGVARMMKGENKKNICFEHKCCFFHTNCLTYL